MTLTRLLHKCQELTATEPPHRVAFLQQLCRQLHWFAGVQIRNVATLAGNIVTCSPISDLNPIWVAMCATFTLQSTAGARRVEAKDFFQGYRCAPQQAPEFMRMCVHRTAMWLMICQCRQGDIRGEEVLVRVEVPWPGERDSVHVFKQAHRREDDIAIVNAAIRLRTAPADEACTIASAWLAFGGVGPTVMRCEETAALLAGKPLTRATAMVRAKFGTWAGPLQACMQVGRSGAKVTCIVSPAGGSSRSGTGGCSAGGCARWHGGVP